MGCAWPSGSVVVSTPGVISHSGWPGVTEFNCLKFFISLIDNLYPVKCNKKKNKTALDSLAKLII